jgi:RND superfamily putative drug exporter
MFGRLGRWTAAYPWTICLAWLAVGTLLAVLAPRWDTRTQDDDVRFVPDRFTSVRAHQLMEEAFPQEVTASNLVFAVEQPNKQLTDADFALVDRIAAELSKLRQEAPDLKLGKVETCKDELVGSRLTSPDYQCTLIKVALGTPYLALATADAVDRARAVVLEQVRTMGAGAPEVYATGAAGVGHDLTRTTGDSLEKTTLATVVLVIVVLLLVYRAPLLALIPLLTIAVSVWVALNVLALLTLIPGVHLVNISKIFAIVILYGAGTDYCLFLISRYREELEHGHELPEAIARGVSGVGAALAASAATVMIGLGLMALAEFAKVRYAGPAIALSLGVSLLASLTLTPALLRLLGMRAFWPHKPARRRRDARHAANGMWDWISTKVAARPVLVWSVAVVFLLPLAFLGARVPTNYCATSELSPRVESLQGLRAIKEHFTAGEIGPLTVLLVSNTDWNDREARLELDHLSRGFAGLENVAEVRSLTQPLGTPLPDLTPLPDGEGFFYRLLVALQPALQDFREEMNQKAAQHYVARIDGGASSSSEPQYVTRLDVILKSDPFNRESAETLKTIQIWLEREQPRTTLLAEPIQSEFYGVTACAQDLEALTEGDRHRVNSLVLAAILVVLLALVRKLTLGLYLLATVLLSYFAALGATVLAGVLWTGAPLPHVDWRVPFFLFTILVAVGEDYNILLVTRAIQERKRFGAVEGMRRALARTGGAITSCGLIMAGTFATLMLAGLNTLIQIGFALACGVLIDTFVVRPFLVPAFAVLFWKDDREERASVLRMEPAPIVRGRKVA